MATHRLPQEQRQDLRENQGEPRGSHFAELPDGPLSRRGTRGNESTRGANARLPPGTGYGTGNIFREPESARRRPPRPRLRNITLTSRGRADCDARFATFVPRISASASARRVTMDGLIEMRNRRPERVSRGGTSLRTWARTEEPRTNIAAQRWKPGHSVPFRSMIINSTYVCLLESQRWFCNIR